VLPEMEPAEGLAPGILHAKAFGKLDHVTMAAGMGGTSAGRPLNRATPQTLGSPQHCCERGATTRIRAAVKARSAAGIARLFHARRLPSNSPLG
jgi:hypothetical protein